MAQTALPEKHSRRFIDTFSAAIREHEDFTRTDEHIVQGRFIEVVRRAERELLVMTILYYALTNMITVGGILIVSLMAIAKLEGISDHTSNVLYWISWSMAALVSIGNKLLYEYGIPKKFIIARTVLEKYHSEGWSLIGGIDRYSQMDDFRERLQLFYERIEKINAKALSDVMAMTAKRNNGLGASSGSNISPNITTRGQPRSRVTSLATLGLDMIGGGSHQQRRTVSLPTDVWGDGMGGNMGGSVSINSRSSSDDWMKGRWKEYIQHRRRRDSLNDDSCKMGSHRFRRPAITHQHQQDRYQREQKEEHDTVSPSDSVALDISCNSSQDSIPPPPSDDEFADNILYDESLLADQTTNAVNRSDSNLSDSQIIAALDLVIHQYNDLL